MSLLTAPGYPRVVVALRDSSEQSLGQNLTASLDSWKYLGNGGAAVGTLRAGRAIAVSRSAKILAVAWTENERKRETDGLRPGDAVDGVYRRLRDLIVEGGYAPSERLKHAELARRLGAGRMSVRQALHRLEGEGLVVSSPNRGVRVAPAAISYAEELYAVRLVVEPPLLAALAGNLTPAELRRMHDELGRMEAIVDQPPAFQVAHRDFHMVAASDYSSPFIADLVVRVHRHLFRHQRAYMSRPRVPEDFVAIDRELLRALEVGDGLRARALYELHLIDMAIGMVLDAEPEHCFGVLLRVAAANGIEIEASPDGRIDRPARVGWRSTRSQLLLRTSNVHAS